MSFYIGKDFEGTQVVAVSKEEESAVSLSNALNFSNLAYHSKYQYLHVDTYTTIVSMITGTYYDSWTVKVYHVPVPNALFKVNGTRRMFLLLVDGGSLPVTCYTDSTYQSTFSEITVDVAHPCYNYTDDTILLTIPNGAASVSVEFILFNTDSLGNTIIGTAGGPTTISTQSFIVNGTDYLTAKWLVTPSVNTADSIINLFGVQFQIVNSVPTTGAVAFSTAGGGTSVTHGGKVILASTGNYHKMLYNPNTSIFMLGNPTKFYLGQEIIVRSGLPTIGPIGLLLMHGFFSQYNPFETIPYSIPILYNPTQDTGYVPILPTRYPGYGGSYICYGTLYIRINNGNVSVIEGHHYCSGGTVPDVEVIWAGPYQVATTHVVL